MRTCIVSSSRQPPSVHGFIVAYVYVGPKYQRQEFKRMLFDRDVVWC